VQMPSGHSGVRNMIVKGVMEGQWDWSVGGSGGNNVTVGGDNILSFSVTDINQGAILATFRG
jgi:hypothetical protein